jgi:hypothetical protein
MPDFRKMTVESLRELAREVLGPGYSRKTKRELIAALEGAGARATAPAREAVAKVKPKPRTAGGRAAQAAGKAVKAAKAAGSAAREGVRAAARAGKAAAKEKGAAAARERAATPRAKRGKVAAAAAAVAGAAAGAVAGVAAAVRASRRRAGNGEPGEATPDPDGYFVARVRGEEAVREAPHPLTETTSDAPEAFRAVEEVRPGEGYEEDLGELPWGYGDDAFVALPRDPRTLFLYWDFSGHTTAAAFAGLEHPRVQLWVFARAGAGWDRIRTIDFALEARGYYVHDLDPGRVYRSEVHALDQQGRERLVGKGSNEMMLPPIGPSAIVDDRFIRIPWEMPLGRLLGPGHAGGPFSDEARALLARLSDWSRFAARTGGGSAGGMGGRPTSPAVSSPSSPVGPFGAREGA